MDETPAAPEQGQVQVHIEGKQEPAQEHPLVEKKVDSGHPLWNAAFDTCYDIYDGTPAPAQEQPPAGKRFDPGDELWQATFDTYYAVYLHELTAIEILNRWAWVDEINKFLIAITTASSLVSGWAIWKSSDFDVLRAGKLGTFWIIVAAVSTFLGIVHTSLAVAWRQKDWNGMKNWASGLRSDLENFRYKMKVYPTALLSESMAEFN